MDSATTNHIVPPSDTEETGPMPKQPIQKPPQNRLPERIQTAINVALISTMLLFMFWVLDVVYSLIASAFAGRISAPPGFIFAFFFIAGLLGIASLTLLGLIMYRDSFVVTVKRGRHNGTNS